MISDETTDAYGRDGFVFFPDLLGAENVAAMQDEVQSILEDTSDTQRVILEKDGKTPRTIINPQLWNALFARLVRHPSLLAGATALLSEDIYA